MQDTTSCLGVKQVATMLSVSEKTIRRKLYDREIGFYKLGNRILISESHLKSYLSSKEIKPFDDKLLGDLTFKT
jgi:excisionase family DNA binding protein